MLPGASPQSLGLHVAKMCRFPDQVIEEATAKAAELSRYADVRYDADADADAVARVRAWVDMASDDVSRDDVAVKNALRELRADARVAALLDAPAGKRAKSARDENGDVQAVQLDEN